MNMTENAKQYILSAMKENNADTLRFYGVAGCCGMNLAVGLVPAEEGDQIEKVNDVNIAIMPEMAQELQNVTINVEEQDGEMGLVLEGYAPSCGC
ncbi:Fe-S cluster assembly protein HesB [Rummeliibacillus sp. TYF005]|uniref:Fe-S cluster assembly protein HesB n=1 Tax=unclassified Rummeliibacillus TaxID=2622809 RepID=UPI000E66D0CC|nr:MULTISPECIES: Fe-S cluster assembly protein HesB [unclassified Rummeliibacillus]RIJ64527.1 Fe-S cluster assembly protein HesB [Rummeliibacillus sp. POC4]RPJ96406.1 Fe-S cluster assembly protein HesB [Rummeliibacillus sp. TYF005]